MTGIQSRILVTLFQSGEDAVNNETILKGSGVSRSTWAVEQNRLIELGLIEKRSVRSISRNNVFRTVNYKLTAKGKAIALSLIEISNLLESRPKAAVTENPISDKVDVLDMYRYEEDSEFYGLIRESIEIALEGYGVNFLKDVRSSLEGEYQVPWSKILGRIDLLVRVLKDFFGAEGARTIESMISANIRSRFGLEKKEGEDDDLQALIAMAASVYKAGAMRAEEALSSNSQIPVDSKGQNTP